MNRRAFFGATAAGIAGLSSARFAWAQAVDPKVDWKKIRQSTLDRIAIMTLNFQSILKVPDTQPSPTRTLALADIGEMLADTYGVHKVEFQHYHLASVEPSYFRDLRSKLSVETRGSGGGGGRGRGGQGGQAAQGAPGAAPAAPPQGTVAPGAAAATPAPANVPAPAPGAAAPTGQPGAPAPPSSGPDTWPLLAEIIKGAGAYSNVDFGGANAPNQEELHRCLKMMHPMTAGSVHTRVNTRWDLATVIKYLEGELGYKRLYTIETGNGHVGTREIYDVVVATLDTRT